MAQRKAGQCVFVTGFVRNAAKCCNYLAVLDIGLTQYRNDIGILQFQTAFIRPVTAQRLPARRPARAR